MFHSFVVMLLLVILMLMYLILGFMFHVDHPTHLFNGHSHSLIDLVLVSNLLYLYFYHVIPSLANSDHLGVMLQMKLKVSLKPVCPPRPKIWLYSQANWTKACELINAFDWSSLFSNDINETYGTLHWFVA